MSFLGPLANPIFLVPIVGLGGFYYGQMQKGGTRTEVLQLRPRDKRGITLKGQVETDLGITCKKIKGITHRFVKAGPGWSFGESGSLITRFLGVEGTAYTAMLENGVMVHKTLAEYLLFLWGEDFFESIPNSFKKALIDDKIGVTVEIERLDPEIHGLPTITADDINDETDSKILRKIGGETEKTLGQNLYIMGIWFAMGALTMFFLLSKGII